MKNLRRTLMWWAPAFVLAAAGWFVLPLRQSSAPVIATIASSPASPGAGQGYYTEYCAACHGADGRGTSRGPTLQGIGRAEVDFQLSTGRMPRRGDASRQPPYKAILPPAVVRALDDYVTALAAHGGPDIPAVDPAAGDVARGGELFRINCAACHSELGQGGEFTDRPIPAVTEATPTQVAEAVRAGAAQMPRFGNAAVSASDLNDIAAYIQYLKRPEDKGGNAISHLGPVAEGMIAWFVGMVVLLGFIRWIGQRG